MNPFPFEATVRYLRVVLSKASAGDLRPDADVIQDLESRMISAVSDVDDPYTVEVGQPMSEWSLLIVCFEGSSTPLNLVELREPQRWREVYKAGLVETQISVRSIWQWG